ncbi:unnamed protein product, partial [Ectocarpus sp. 12 AP-2014]
LRHCRDLGAPKHFALESGITSAGSAGTAAGGADTHRGGSNEPSNMHLDTAERMAEATPLAADMAPRRPGWSARVAYLRDGGGPELHRGGERSPCRRGGGAPGHPDRSRGGSQRHGVREDQALHPLDHGEPRIRPSGQGRRRQHPVPVALV